MVPAAHFSPHTGSLMRFLGGWGGVRCSVGVWGLGGCGGGGGSTRKTFIAPCHDGWIFGIHAAVDDIDAREHCLDVVLVELLGCRGGEELVLLHTGEVGKVQHAACARAGAQVRCDARVASHREGEGCQRGVQERRRGRRGGGGGWGAVLPASKRCMHLQAA